MECAPEMRPRGDDQHGSRNLVPPARSSKPAHKRTQDHGASSRPKSSASKRPEAASRPADQRNRKGGAPSTASGPTAANESWASSAGRLHGRAHSSRQTEQQQTREEPTTSRSDTGPGERLFPRYGSKMPVSPRRARSVIGATSEPQCRTDKFSPAPEAVPAYAPTKVAKLNHHVASTVGTAVPKGEVWHEQLPRGAGAGGRTLTKTQASAMAGRAETGQRKWTGGSHSAPKVLKGAAPKSRAEGRGSVKPSRRTIKSTGMNVSRKGKSGKGTTSTVESHGEDSATAKAAGRTQGTKVDDEGPSNDTDVSKKPRAPLESFPSPPYVVGRDMPPDESSSDSDGDPRSDVLPSPKVVRATGHSSSERETPRSGLPRTAHMKPHMTSNWNTSTPRSDRSHHQVYPLRQRDGARTSMEQEVDGAPQNTPLSPTVSDAFNMHFAAREDQNWLVDENKPQLGFEPEMMNWNFPFSCPRRSSNPGSEISGVSELSRYQHRQNESDLQSGPKRLGLGRFGGQMFQALGDGGCTAARGVSGPESDSQQKDPESNKQAQRIGTISRNVGNSFSDASLDVGDEKVQVARAKRCKRHGAILPNQQVLVQQDILQSPKGRSPGTSPKCADKVPLHEHRINGQSGNQYMQPGSQDGSTIAHSGRSAPYRPTGQDMHVNSLMQNGYIQRTCELIDDDRSSHGGRGRPNSACGGNRTPLGARILRIAVFAAAGVAAVVFGGELLKTAVIVDDDSDDEEHR